jgi:hypothetical protein
LAKEMLGGAAISCGSTYNMGMGPLGNPENDLKRKFRFLFQVQFCNNTRIVPPYFVKSSSRPKLTIEETELNFLNSKTFITGKPTWEPITVTYLDVDTGENFELWSWIGTIYNFFGASGGNTNQQSNQACYTMGRRKQYEGIGKLQMLDGCGGITESWTLQNMFPNDINFGEVAYEDSGTVDIEVTLRYSSVQYENFCGKAPSPCPCTPCS